MAKRKRARLPRQSESPAPDVGLVSTLESSKGQSPSTSRNNGAASPSDNEGWTVVGPNKRSRKEYRDKPRTEAASSHRMNRSPRRSQSAERLSAEEMDASDKRNASPAEAPFESFELNNQFSSTNGDSNEPSNPFRMPQIQAELAKESTTDTRKRQAELAKMSTDSPSEKLAREERRKERKLERHYPAIEHSHHARPQSHTRISDLQSLALYILADGTAPQWVSVRNRGSFRQVVVLMVPGLSLDMFNEDPEPDDTTMAMDQDSLPKRTRLDPDDYYPKELSYNKLPNPLKPLSRIFDHVWPIKAPVEKRGSTYLKVHSPIHTMLTSYIPKTREEKQLKKSASHKGPLPQNSKDWDNQRTSIIEYLATLIEQQENKYVVHPAWFTTDEAKEVAHQKRKAIHSTVEDGWVDSNVTRLEDGDVREEDIEQGSVTAGRRVLAVDCEMCISDDDKRVLTRISLVDWNGDVIMDELVKPDVHIKDYVTQFSGITEKKLQGVTTTLQDIQKELLDILTPHTILVGHSLESDLDALKLTHPFLIDTGILFPHVKGPPYKQSLRWLTQKFLHREIQKGSHGHDSVEDALACLHLVKQKCERGPKWGTIESNVEPIFKRLQRTYRPKTHDTRRAGAVVDWGDPNRGHGLHAQLCIGCGSDDEVVEGIKLALSGQAVGKNHITDKVDFVWARLRELELARGWWDGGKSSEDVKALRQATLKRLDFPPDWPGDDNLSGQALAKEVSSTIDRIAEIYNTLPPCTALIVYSGTDDPREVRRLVDMQQRYKREYATQNWDKLSVKWTKTEVEALSKAVQRARQSVALIGVT